MNSVKDEWLAVVNDTNYNQINNHQSSYADSTTGGNAQYLISDCSVQDTSPVQPGANSTKRNPTPTYDDYNHMDDQFTSNYNKKESSITSPAKSGKVTENQQNYTALREEHRRISKARAYLQHVQQRQRLPSQPNDTLITAAYQMPTSNLEDLHPTGQEFSNKPLGQTASEEDSRRRSFHDLKRYLFDDSLPDER